MSNETPRISAVAAHKLLELGQKIRAHRKEMKISATAAAEAANMSRVTLYRIEKGEPSVAVGAYFSAMTALNLDYGILEPSQPIAKDDIHRGWIPVRIRLSDYPQLKQLAWQVYGIEELTPMEALSIYERNWRHVEVAALEPHEKQLIDALRMGLGEAVRHV